jgi:hypothetical protein
MAMIRLELTEAQKEQVRAATGREVNVLELRLQAGREPAAGAEAAAAPEIPALPARGTGSPPSPRRAASRHPRWGRAAPAREDQEKPS